MRVTLRVNAIIIVASLVLWGCINSADNTGKAGTSTGTVARTPSASQGTLPSAGSQSLFTVSSVMRSNAAPDSTLDLVGDDGSIGQYCPFTGNNNGQATYDCKCAFQFVESNGVLRQDFQDLSLAETNLARCLFTSKVPAYITNFNVALVTSNNQFSNWTNISMPVLNPSLDPAVNANYSLVQRFQCRDMISNMSQNTGFYDHLLDPKLWDLSLVFNFYTTSLGADYGAIAEPASSGGGVVPVPGYECPLIPNDATENSVYDLKVYSLAAVDLNNPNDPNVPVGDITIYPPDDNFGLAVGSCTTGKETTCEKYALNRHDYYLANFKSTIYSQPVCLNHKVSNIAISGASLDCTINTASTTVTVGAAGVGRDIIGFAAFPDVNENCPSVDQMTIPANKKWAKLWRFRTSYQPRSIQDTPGGFPTASNPQAMNAIGDLLCTTRDKECLTGSYDSTVPAAGDDFYTQCYDVTNPSGPGLGATRVPEVATVPSAWYGNCNSSGTVGDGRARTETYFTPAPNVAFTYFNQSATCGTYGCCTDVGGSRASFVASTRTTRSANFTPGGDFCNPTLIGSHNSAYLGGLAKDVWLMGQGTYKACIEADTDANGRLNDLSFPPAVANPYVTSSRQIDAASKSDYLYVVTPASLKLADMQDPQTNNKAKQYTPWRWKPGGAPGEKQVYNLDLGSGNTSNPNDRFSKFPLCVLQDSRAGSQ